MPSAATAAFALNMYLWSLFIHQTRVCICSVPLSLQQQYRCTGDSALLGSMSYNASTTAHHAGRHPSVPRLFSGLTLPKELSVRFILHLLPQIWNAVKHIAAKSLVRKRGTGQIALASVRTPRTLLLRATLQLFQLTNTSCSLESRANIYASIS